MRTGKERTITPPPCATLSLADWRAYLGFLQVDGPSRLLSFQVGALVPAELVSLLYHRGHAYVPLSLEDLSAPV